MICCYEIFDILSEGNMTWGNEIDIYSHSIFKICRSNTGLINLVRGVVFDIDL